ncbi:amidohydrolase [Ruicaihuangia caeni]|uniref:Amidohydrolase family protein n=1 Tax=Ruicaihuangia caeni TaxID=3042517 RepID=A0AAW6T990_9MICO|nr:amidohydrolase family protein [Klugiella sp. YN-L-19]MDI2098914.1 amidohydrolase family protein [Klugiella sp. YN-L-19]
MDAEAPAGAIGIRTDGGSIAGYVTREEVAAAQAAGIPVTDFGDRTIMPGFIDVHAHGEVAVRAAWGTVDCRAPHCATVEDVLARLSNAVAERREGWVVGQGNLFLDRKLRDGRLPTRAELDRVSATVPIAVRAGGHISALNSAALAELGIDREYREPAGSLSGKPVVERDERGEPTGVVKEMDSLMPVTGPADDEIEDALRGGFRELFAANGVTTIGEISETHAGLRAMESLAARNENPVNVRTYLWVPGTLPLDDALDWRRALGVTGAHEGFGVRGLKLFSDGGYSAKNAALDTAYVGEPHNHGHIALDEEYLRDTLLRAAEAGLQVAVHANGPRAQLWVARLIERLRLPAGAPRPRIEHAGNYMPDAEAPGSWRDADIIPVPQPVFIYTFGDFFVDYLGDIGKVGRFPLKSLRDQGWPITSSSDVWVGSEPQATNPLFGVWCAVRRQSFHGLTIDDHEALEVSEALELVTTNAATVLGEERRGSLKPGNHADFIVLDRDPLSVAIDDLPHITVHQTFVSGAPQLT